MSLVVSANEITALNINGKDSLWIDRGWRTTDTDKDSGLSETKLLSNANSQSNYTSDAGTDYAEVDTRNMSTFYNCRKVNRDILVKKERKKKMKCFRFQSPENPTPYATTMIVGTSSTETTCLKTSGSSTDQDSGTHSPNSEGVTTNVCASNNAVSSKHNYHQYPPGLYEF